MPDCYTASKLVRYIAQHFIDNPDDKAWGEAALLLWLMVWSAQETPGMVTKDQLLSIRTIDLNTTEATVTVNNVTIEISDNLSLFLQCLHNRSSGEKEKLIFNNLNSKSLERIMHRASVAILGAEVTPIMPSAFLSSLHIYANIRMPYAQRHAMQKGRLIVNLPDFNNA